MGASDGDGFLVSVGSFYDGYRFLVDAWDIFFGRPCSNRIAMYSLSLIDATRIITAWLVTSGCERYATICVGGASMISSKVLGRHRCLFGTERLNVLRSLLRLVVAISVQCLKMQ